MAAELVPVRLGVTAGDLYTLWAPRWRDGGDEWEAFLGKDDDLYAFESVADLAAFVRSNTDNDLADHPAWEALTTTNAHKLEPGEQRQTDLVAVEELLAAKPTEESVTTLANTMAVVSWNFHMVRARYIFGQCFGGTVTMRPVPRSYDYSVLKWAETYAYQFVALGKATVLGCDSAQ